MRRGLVSLGTDLMQEVNIEPAFHPVATCFRNVSSRSFNNLLLISLDRARTNALQRETYTEAAVLMKREIGRRGPGRRATIGEVCWKFAAEAP